MTKRKRKGKGRRVKWEVTTNTSPGAKRVVEGPGRGHLKEKPGNYQGRDQWLLTTQWHFMKLGQLLCNFIAEGKNPKNPNVKMPLKFGDRILISN